MARECRRFCIQQQRWADEKVKRRSDEKQMRIGRCDLRMMVERKYMNADKHLRNKKNGKKEIRPLTMGFLQQKKEEYRALNNFKNKNDIEEIKIHRAAFVQ